MSRMQIIGICVAILFGAAAMMFMFSQGPAPAPVVQIMPNIEIDKVLIAKNDLPYGLALSPADTEWIDWPKSAIPLGVIAKSSSPKAQEEYSNAHVLIPTAKGDPIRAERLAKGVTAGVMATMLPSGKRAVAVDIAVNTTAGGFILPNDRVDVMRIYRDGESSREMGKDIFSTELVLPNMRVLAIGQTIEKRNNEAVVIGSTATLEVDPRQTEALLIAQKTGQLVLVLRSIRDANPRGTAEEAPVKPAQDESLTIVKYGIPTTMRAK